MELRAVWIAPFMVFSTAWIAASKLACACAGGAEISTATIVPATTSATMRRFELAVNTSQVKTRKNQRIGSSRSPQSEFSVNSYARPIADGLLDPRVDLLAEKPIPSDRNQSAKNKQDSLQKTHPQSAC